MTLSTRNKLSNDTSEALHPYFRAPKLLGGSNVTRDADGFLVAVHGMESKVECNVEAAPQVQILLDALKRGVDPTRSRNWDCEFTSHARSIVVELDRHGFITDRGPPQMGDCLSGPQLWHELRKVVNVQTRKSHTPFATALQSGSVTGPMLTSYAKEYWYIVAHAPRLIAPILAHSHDDRSLTLLRTFVSSELHHEHFLLKALAAIGTNRDQLLSWQVSEPTYCFVATLGVLAAQDPLAFKACLFILESPNDAFHSAFRDACIAAGLPDAFCKPILAHASVNDSESHGDISRLLLQHIECISNEAANAVLKHAVSLVQMLSLIDEHIASAT